MSERAIGTALVERIRQRLTVDWRRTGDGDYLRMPRELRRRDAPGGPLGWLWSDLNDRAAADALAKDLKPIEPLTAAAIARVERSLGFSLPPQLRQVYLEIGDGGFGPFNGIRRLANAAKDYTKLREETPPERGRDWPEGLLPIVYLNGKRICVAADRGAVILWTKPPKKASQKAWLASFVLQAASVEAWLERWVDTPTAAEGGPEGGWTPPSDEVARRAEVEQAATARRDAAAEKARTFTAAELEPLPDPLVERIRARATDPARRTYMASTAEKATPVTLDGLAGELDLHAGHLPPQAMTGLAGMLSGLRKLGPLTGGLRGLSTVTGPEGGTIAIRSGAGGRLGAPATDEALQMAEARLRVRLPEPLRQLYRIADGGFGPGDSGLLSLSDVVRRYRQLTSKPQGPGGEAWPARLLPIWESGDEIGCLDLESGAITSYDPSRMADIHGGYWRRSFAREQPSIAALLETWLAEGTFEEATKPGSATMREAMAKLPPEEDPAEIAVAYFAKLTPAERADAGLPDVGWENELRRRHRGF